MIIKNILKTYGDKYQILEYKRAINIEQYLCKKHHNSNCSICHPRKGTEPHTSSIIRTKTAITDYCLMNNFQLFCTFTFDPKKTDSFSINEVYPKMQNWLNNQKKSSPDIAYLIVPELHKSGRIHFHALLKNYNSELTDSGLKKNNRTIYNISKWKWGFSTAIEIDNTEKVAYYIQKYITKELVTQLNKKRYWNSKNLLKPSKEYNVDITSVTLGKADVNKTYETEYFTIYKSIPKVEDIITQLNKGKQ